MKDGPTSPTHRPARRPLRGLPIYLLLLATAGCWWESARREVEALDPTAPRVAEQPAADATPDAPPGLPEPTGLPATSTAAEASAPEPVLAVLPGGLRLVTARDSGTADGDVAWLQLTLRHGIASGTRLASARILAALAVSSTPPGDGDPLPLARFVAVRGGTLEVDVDMAATRFTLRVPSHNWRATVERLATAVTTPPATGAALAPVRDAEVRRFTSELAAAPLDAVVERVRSFDLLGISTWLASAEDATPAQLARLHRQVYRSSSAVLALRLPGGTPRTVATAAAELLRPWLDDATDSSPQVFPPREPARGFYWARGDAPTRGAVVFELAPLTHPRAALQRTALECLTHGGVGGRLAAELDRRLAEVPEFTAELIDDGHGRRLELRFDAPADQFRAIDAAVRAAWRSLARHTPQHDELATAVGRARLRALHAWNQPRRWLDGASHAAVAGLRPTLVVDADGCHVVPGNPPTPCAGLLVALGRPEALAGDDAWQAYANPPALVVVTGGDSGARRADDTFVAVRDSFVPERRLAVVTATPDEQRTLAAEVLERAARAVGGPQRLLAIRGYHGLGITRSGRGPEAIDEVWYDGDAERLHRVRHVLGTEIVTRIEGAAGTTSSGDEQVELDADAARAELAAAGRQPLLLLERHVSGEDRYRAVSLRQVDGRDHAILERENGAATSHLRLHVDADSGLIRSIVTRAWRGGERVTVRTDHRDYRRIDDGVRVPFWRATWFDDAPLGLVTTWERFSAGTPEFPEPDSD